MRNEEIRVGDKVRERTSRVPEGCQPFESTAEYVAADGWVSVKLGPRTFSFAPHELEKVSHDPFAESRGPDDVIGQDADYLEQIADARAAEAETIDMLDN